MITNNNTLTAETVFNQKCRVCLEQGNIQIFSDLTSELPQHLRIFGDIEVTENDNYPKFLCQHCHNSLNVAVNFRNTAKKTQLILKKLEQSSNKKLSQIYLQEEIEILNALHALDTVSRQNSDEENIYESCKKENDEWNDFEDQNESSDKSVSADESISRNFNKNGIDRNDQAELQIVPDRPPFPNEHSNSWKDEPLDSNSLDIGPPQSLNENINQIYKEEQLLFSTTLKTQQKTQHTNNRVNRSSSKTKKLKVSRTRVKTKCSDESITQSCGEEDIKHLKVSEVTAHCDKYFKTVQVADTLNYQCNICKRTLLCKQSRTSHLVAHLPLSEYNYICEVCGKKFVRNGDLQQHLSVHYVKTIFKCDMCPYKGHTRDLLKCHLKVHSDQFRYSCTLCPKKFKSNSNLHVHLRRHGKPMFQCETCLKSFYENASLKKHIESQHLGIQKLNKCDQCGKVYLQRKKLLQHQNKVHKREKVYTRANYLKAESNRN